VVRAPAPKIITRQRATGYVNIGEMARKKKVKRFRAVEAVKALARERIGAPKASQVVIDRTKKKEKHKPTLGKLLDEA
jgi:hypothetical protein